MNIIKKDSNNIINKRNIITNTDLSNLKISKERFELEGNSNNNNNIKIIFQKNYLNK